MQIANHMSNNQKIKIMKTEIAIINENDKKILEKAISKANKVHEWNISVSFSNFNKYETAEITTETSEQVLFLGMYMGRLGF